MHVLRIRYDLTADKVHYTTATLQYVTFFDSYCIYVAICPGLLVSLVSYSNSKQSLTVIVSSLLAS